MKWRCAGSRPSPVNGTRNTGAADSPDLRGPVFPFLNVVDLDEARVRAPRRRALPAPHDHQRVDLGVERQAAGPRRVEKSARSHPPCRSAPQRSQSRWPPRRSARGQGGFRGGAGDVNDARQRLHQLPADRQTIPSSSSTPCYAISPIFNAAGSTRVASRRPPRRSRQVHQLPLVVIIKTLPTGFLPAETAPITCVFFAPSARQTSGSTKNGARNLERFRAPRSGGGLSS